MTKIVGSISRGQAHEILNQIENAIKASGVNPEEQAREFIRSNFFGNKTKEFFAEAKHSDPILKLISSGEKLILRPRDGSRTIHSSKNVFSVIDSDFKDYGANEKGEKTGETEVDVYEMTKDANFAEMFSSLNNNPEALCLTQDQILEFIEMHKRWLRTEGYATLFLFKSNNQFFVAYVYFGGDGSLKVYVYRFGDDHVWDAGYRDRVVVPQRKL